MLIGAGNVVKGGVTLSKPVPSPASVVTSSGSVNEGSSITFTSTSVGVPDGTTLYWSMYGYGSATSDADFDSVTGSFTVVNGVGTFPVDIIADNLTEGAQSFSVAVRTESISGAIIGISDTVIINDTSVNRPHWTDGDATATGEIVTYRYYKFHITKTRNMPPTLNATQISELIILNGSNRLPGGTASNPDGHTGENEGPDKALDGYYDNKICDQYFTTNGNSSTIIVDYTSAQSSNGFTFAVANDSPSRDPVRWTFEGSNDGSTWTVLHEQLNDAAFEYQRNRLAGTVFNYQVHGSAAFVESEGDYLSVAAGSQFNLGTTWTIEFWLKANAPSTSANGGIWGLLNQVGWDCTNAINIALSDGKLCVGQGGQYSDVRFTEPNPGIPESITSFSGGGSWEINQGSNIATTGGTGTGLTVDVAAAGSGYAGAVYIHTPGTGYSNGDVITAVSGDSYVSFTIYVAPPEWTHIAIVNNAGTQKLFYNGVEQIKVSGNYSTANYTNSTDPLYIGRLGPHNAGTLNGSMTNLRITNTAIYSSNFYPPDLKPAKIAGTKLLWTPTDQSLTTDNSDSAAAITNHGAVYSVEYPPADNIACSSYFNGSSYYQVGRSRLSVTATMPSGNATLPGDVSGSYVYCVNAALAAQVGDTFTADGQTCTIAEVRSVADNLIFVGFTPRITVGAINSSDTIVFSPVQPWNLGTTWTVEWWSKANHDTSDRIHTVVCQQPGVGIDIFYDQTTIAISNGSGGYIRTSGAHTEPTVGVWTHVAVVNNAGTLAVYYNGVAQTLDSYVGPSWTNTSASLAVGERGVNGDTGAVNGFQYFNGKLADIRITNTAVYTEDFIPDQPITRLTGHTKLLLNPTFKTVYGVDAGDLALPISNRAVSYNVDYPVPIVYGNAITTTVTGDAGSYSLSYTNNGAPIGSITVKDVPTYGSINIVDKTLVYIAPCYQGEFNSYTQKYEGSEIDNFSLYFKGLGYSTTIVPVSITINHSG